MAKHYHTTREEFLSRHLNVKSSIVLPVCLYIVCPFSHICTPVCLPCTLRHSNFLYLCHAGNNKYQIYQHYFQAPDAHVCFFLLPG